MEDIGVKVEKDPGRSSGLGYNPFHMDLVNATRLPEYTTRLCVRPDLLGGVTSTFSDAHAAVARLSENSRSLLAETAYNCNADRSRYENGQRKIGMILRSEGDRHAASRGADEGST